MLKRANLKYFNRYIDSAYKPKNTLVLRYLQGIPSHGLSKDDFKKMSLKEGAGIYRWMSYKDVSIYIADESTMMTGGTYKALEACFTTAICRKNGYKKIAFSSGGNTGTALTIYGQHAKIETFFFCPKNVFWKLNGDLFKPSTAHLISVDKPEKEVKKASFLFSQLAGIPLVPKIEWRLSATGLRGYFVFEYMLKKRIRFNWICQSLCAGYGPIGFYNVAKRMIRENIISKADIPRLLGIQQEALSPMVRAWKNKHNQIMPQDIVSHSHKLFVPNLYNTNPHESYPVLYKHLLDFGGCLLSLNKQEFNKYCPLILKMLAHKGINLTTRHIKGQNQILEKAGVLSLVGCFKAIDEGIIKKGQTVLCFFTGGLISYPRIKAKPDYEIKRRDNLVKALKKYLNTLL